MPLPDPDQPYPIHLPDGSPHRGTVMLRSVTDHPCLAVGAYTYASDFDPPGDWTARLAPYLFPFSQERLIIGKFCQIAHGVRFLTASANHATDGLSCYPFPIFDGTAREGYQPDQRDTLVGNDVWFGHGATILPGAYIGHGAIIGAGAVVRGIVPDYAIVTGNPGTVARYRFAPDVIERLLALAWWDWPVEVIEAAIPAIMAGDVNALEKLAPAG
ncbi:CatB-related O-acetyltransferase [Shimia sp. W99]